MFALPNRSGSHLPMSGINQVVVYCVCRLKSHFVDPIGNRKSCSGTGFWIRHKGQPVLATNRHNVDAKLFYGESSEYTLRELEVELRNTIGDNFTGETKFFSVKDLEDVLFKSEDADVAILRAPKFTSPLDDFGYKCFAFGDIADSTFFSSKVSIMDFASFVGYPGRNGKSWWDISNNLGIARTVNVASIPGAAFQHSDVRTTDVTLVSGLSFSGSSGSVVLLHQKGIAPTGDIVDSSFVPVKIIGIMSGHWSDAENGSGMFQHTGLSYYTRSTALVHLLERTASQ